MYILLGDTPACLPCAMWLLYHLQRLRDADFVVSINRLREGDNAHLQHTRGAGDESRVAGAKSSTEEEAATEPSTQEHPKE
jgi:hypothetical protein